MDIKYWKALAGLGIPGVALGLFYKLYDKFDWPLARLAPELVFVLILVFMLLISAVVFFALFLWRPRPEVKTTSTGVSISIPKNCTLRAAATVVARDRLIAFEGFSENELSSPLEPRQLTAATPEYLIEQLGRIATRNVRSYRVSVASAGNYVARVA
ncbi:hypothetical protein [Rhizobacter sp. Root1221]|uniref:hypothetical protein n=1 Tax=Rhizobacter sp. Root1221 TaxID=1736433 RepID=UPI0006F39508|nr:hypothetical protein [Rhizobacter sp. Root1221]KQV84558.1 hypothetical protein ASC87_29875 [Rhizobacter sp. Root1221]